MLKLMIRHNVKIDGHVEEYCGGEKIVGVPYFYSLYMNWIDPDKPDSEDLSKQEFISDHDNEEELLDKVRAIKGFIPTVKIEQKSYNVKTGLFQFKEI